MSGPTPLTPVLPSHLSRIVLTGFMGAGKSTVGSILAARLGWRFSDTDQLIEARAGMTIADLFTRRGEPAFRVLEAAVIREAAEAEAVILALGGGAIETPSTRELLGTLPETLVVFLDAPLETLIARCRGHQDGPVRPVLADRERLEERWRSRQPWYRQAHLTLPTAQLAPDAVAELILNTIPTDTIRAHSRIPAAGAPA